MLLDGIVPDTVIYSFYVGAVILILCVLYTIFNVKEMSPEEYVKYHRADEKNNINIVQLLRHAPKVFWSVGLTQFFCWSAFVYMWTYTNGGIAETIWHTTNAKSADYQAAGNWVGVLFAVQSVGSILWAMVLPFFKSNKSAYSLSLLLGGIGFISIFFIRDQYLLFASYMLIGCAWAAILALPFTILTNSLKGRGNMGAYLGLFNGTICLPQIIASLLGGLLYGLVGESSVMMLLVAGVLLVLGALSVFNIKENNDD